MARDGLTDAMGEGLSKRNVPGVLLAEFEFDSGTLRVCSGPAPLVYNGNTYLSGGKKVGISAYSETQDMAANGMAYELSGIDTSLLAAAYLEPYRGRACRLLLALRKEDVPWILEDGTPVVLETGEAVIVEHGNFFELVADPYTWFEGLMNVMHIDRSGPTATITLQADNELIILKRAKERRYTSEDQKAEFPGDKGMDFANALQDAQVLWGQKTA
jgi:hypothetical protein